MSDEIASPSPIKVTWLLGTLAAFALFALIAAYSSRMTWDTSDYDQDRATQRYDTLAKVRHDENILLEPVNPDNKQGPPTAEWVDQTKGIIRIPIEEAMAKEVDTLKSKPAAMGQEIPGSAPAAPTNAVPAKPVAPAAKPAKPAKPAQPVKTTLLTPGSINQPVFNLRRVHPQQGSDAQAFKGFITYGGVSTSLNPSATPVAGPAAAPAKSTFFSPGQPVFKTRPINTIIWVHEGQNIFLAGKLIVDPIETTTGKPN